MALSYADFMIRFPEFSLVSEEMVQAFLDDAELEMDTATWGTLLDVGHGYLTAHKLTLSPMGQNARLATEKGGTTTYEQHYRRLQRSVCNGYRVT